MGKRSRLGPPKSGDVSHNICCRGRIDQTFGCKNYFDRTTLTTLDGGHKRVNFNIFVDIFDLKTFWGIARASAHQSRAMCPITYVVEEE